MADTTLAKTILEMMCAELAECEEMIALGVARPGTAEHADLIRTLLASFAARKPPDLARSGRLPVASVAGIGATPNAARPPSLTHPEASRALLGLAAAARAGPLAWLE
jgi:hypothetical protein